MNSPLGIIQQNEAKEKAGTCTHALVSVTLEYTDPLVEKIV